MARPDGSASSPERHSATASTAAPTPILDREVMLASVEEDLGLLRELAELFFAETPGLLSRLRNGLQARDPELVERSAHTLKGALSNFGALSACQAARELELRGRESRFEGAPELFSALEREVSRASNELSKFLEEVPREGFTR
ncbi:MAG TPA: Hpt domain-containing protein [Candidatus Acidoferrales bacterium]|nr:Hpt domain-containing protein [Candidatus Acidoferrales bacterium]